MSNEDLKNKKEKNYPKILSKIIPILAIFLIYTLKFDNKVFDKSIDIFNYQIDLNIIYNIFLIIKKILIFILLILTPVMVYKSKDKEEEEDND